MQLSSSVALLNQLMGTTFDSMSSATMPAFKQQTALSTTLPKLKSNSGNQNCTKFDEKE